MKNEIPNNSEMLKLMMILQYGFVDEKDVSSRVSMSFYAH